MHHKLTALLLFSSLLFGQDGLIVERDDRTIKAQGIVAMIEYYGHQKNASLDIGRDLSKWTDGDKAYVNAIAKEKLNYMNIIDRLLTNNFNCCVCLDEQFNKNKF